MHQAPVITTPNAQMNGTTVAIEAVANHVLENSQSSSSAIAWQSQKVEQHQDTTYSQPQIQGHLTINAPTVLIDQPTTQPFLFFRGGGREISSSTSQPSFMDQVTVNGTTTMNQVQEIHHHESKSKSGPGGLLGAMVAIGITALTAGAGAPVAGAIGLGGNAIAVGAAKGLVSATATQLTLGTLSNNFNPVEGVKSTVTGDGLKSLATSAITSGVMGGLGLTAPGVGSSLQDAAVYSGAKSLTTAGVNVALGRESFNEAFKNAGTNFLFDVVGRVGANQIGQMYQLGQGRIDYATHKALHAMLGAGLGALKGDIAAGAISGAVSEIVAEAMSGGLENITEKALERAEELGVDPGTEEFMAIVQEQTAASMDWGKLGALVSVALTGHDINVGIDVATNAVENNFAPMVYMGVVAAAQGLAALNAVLTTADGIEAYEKDGWPGVLHLMREDAAIAMSTGGVGKPVLSARKLWKRLGKIKANHVGDGASSSSQPMGIDLDGNLVPKGKGRLVEQQRLVPDYSTPEAPYSLRIDPLTGKGPMHIDSREFTSYTSLTSEGAKRNKDQFWKMWAEKYPETLSENNLKIIKLGRAPEVDSHWLQHFPEHQNFFKQILIHHHIDHGYLVNALPQNLHEKQPGRGMFHLNMGGNKKK